MEKRDASTIGRSNVNRSKDHERQIANNLTKWSGVQFRRRRAEGRGPAVMNIEGAADVIAVGADPHFSIEAKCGKGFSLDAMFSNLRATVFTSWWHQATFDANLLSDNRERKIHPMLFFRPYVNCNWVGFPVQAMPLFVPKDKSQTNLDHNSLWFPHFVFIGYSLVGPVANDVSHSPKHKNIIEVPLSDVVLCRWKDFAAQVDPASFFVSPAVPSGPNHAL